MGFYVTEEHLEDVPRAEARGNENPHRGPNRRVESGFRFYSPPLGRWLSRDPLGDEAFLRLYSAGKSRQAKRYLRLVGLEPLYLFVGNEPVGGSDFLGLRLTPGCPCPCGIDDECCNKMCGVGAGAETRLFFNGIDGSDSNPGGNAFKHCFASCEGVKNAGEQCAKDYMTKRESGDSPGSQKDLANNDVGFGVAAGGGDCWDGCMDKWENGGLDCEGTPCPPPED